MIVLRSIRNFTTVLGYKLDSQTMHMKNINAQGIINNNIVINPSVPQLYQIALLKQTPSDPYTRQTVVSSSGALCAYSGRKTGRQPQNLRIVKESDNQKYINWGKTNIPIDEKSFKLIQKLTTDYISHKYRVFVIDGYAGWDSSHRIKVRTYTSRSYHALFMRNMLIKPSQQDLQNDFSKGVDMHIFNAGDLQASKNIQGITGDMVTALNLKQKKLIIMGSQFAGQMKKGIFKMLQFYYPKKNILTLHASVTQGSKGDIAMLCGLSGTGKTALVMNSSRKLLGDDQACWSDNGVFAIEGGCYAKCINLDKQKQRQIFQAIKFGTVLQNIQFKFGSRQVNFYDSSITQNTRASYPLQFLPSRKNPAVGNHPKNIIFLTSDALGVLPPIASLTYQQGAYQFLSGYTAKLAGTEISVKQPQATFSACFGEIFIPLHPSVYVEMFYNKIKQHNCKLWLLNTGWVKGKYGQGHRIDIETSLIILNAILNGELQNVEFDKFKYFNFGVPKQIKGVDSSLLKPSQGWQNAEQYQTNLIDLVKKFHQNAKKYSNINQNIMQAGPQLL